MTWTNSNISSFRPAIPCQDQWPSTTSKTTTSGPAATSSLPRKGNPGQGMTLPTKGRTAPAASSEWGVQLLEVGPMPDVT